ncbi:DMT family transporter [Deinococcus taeanensis]|uniref:DMT family transporter n=1 Tax=Deinococcus taeanensis TaxID=2737050 RepID=UPI001CDC3CB8|nr:DMT family transporter [Deinococcus taeanensis]UBV43708.1 DMT family transporter [Deinococcus taeanensis]
MNRRDVLDMFLLSAFWGASFLLIRYSGEVFPPVWVALLRSAFGALVLTGALRLGGHALPPARLWRPLLLVALFNNVIPWSFFAWGEQTVSSNIAAIINATTPLFALLIGLTLRDTRVRGVMLAGVLLGLGGVALTVSGGLGGGHATAHGVIVLLLASLGYAVATTIAKRSLSGLNPVGLATTQLGLSAAVLLPVALAGPHPAALTAKATLAVAFLGVVGSGLAYLLYYGLLARVTPTQVTAVTYALPVWGLGWAALAGEPLGWVSVTGVLVVLSGLGLLNFPPRAPRADVPARQT